METHLSTAHPAKFPEIIKDADLELSEIPKTLLDVYNLKERAYICLHPKN